MLRTSHFRLRQSGSMARMLQGLWKSSEIFLLFWIYSSHHNQSHFILSLSLPQHLKQLFPSSFQEFPSPRYILSRESQFWHILFWAQLADVSSHAFLRSKVYPKMYSLPLTQGKRWKLSDLRTAAGSEKTAKTVESTWLISGRYLLK